MSEKSKCPVTGMFGNSRPGSGTMNKDWWPNAVNLKILNQHPEKSNPMSRDYNYAEEFKTLDLQEVKEDLYRLMTDS